MIVDARDIAPSHSLHAALPPAGKVGYSKRRDALLGQGSIRNQGRHEGGDLRRVRYDHKSLGVSRPNTSSGAWQLASSSSSTAPRTSVPLVVLPADRWRASPGVREAHRDYPTAGRRLMAGPVTGIEHRDGEDSSWECDSLPPRRGLLHSTVSINALCGMRN